MIWLQEFLQVDEQIIHVEQPEVWRCYASLWCSLVKVNLVASNVADQLVEVPFAELARSVWHSVLVL